MSNQKPKISSLSPLKGKNGWLEVLQLTISSIEDEDFLIFAGFSEDGEILDEEQIRRIIELKEINLENCYLEPSISEKLKKIIETKKLEILDNADIRSSELLDQEMEKLDNWAEDVKKGMELQLQHLTQEIKLQKAEVRKVLKLEQKLKMQKEIKELEKKRNKMRFNLYEKHDEVDEKKEKLIEQLEEKLKQKLKETSLFCVQWQLI